MVERNDRRGDVGSHGEAGSLASRALRLARADREPGIDRLIGAVPAILAEADRRRRPAPTAGERISAAARLCFPWLAAATAVLVFAALLWSFPSSDEGASGTDEASLLDRWVMTGTAPSSVPDPVLDALVR